MAGWRRQVVKHLADWKPRMTRSLSVCQFASERCIKRANCSWQSYLTGSRIWGTAGSGVQGNLVGYPRSLALGRNSHFSDLISLSGGNGIAPGNCSLLTDFCFAGLFRQVIKVNSYGWKFELWCFYSHFPLRNASQPFSLVLLYLLCFASWPEIRVTPFASCCLIKWHVDIESCRLQVGHAMRLNLGLGGAYAVKAVTHTGRIRDEHS